MKSFDLYVLRRKAPGGFALEKMAVKLYPGLVELPEIPGVRSMSGFKCLMDDVDVHVCPALQLNGDLARFCHEDLLSIAKAELYWKDHVVYRTLLMEPDPRLIVLSGSVDALSEFVDIWGGLLEITPILTKGYHPDFITATKFEIQENSQGLTILCSVRSPFDIDKCTYCALCGPVCPEDCLRENLFLDFDECTSCGACVSVCPNDAIDLYTVEIQEFNAPALLILEDAGVDLSGDLPHVYSQGCFHDLVSTMCARQVEEVVSLDQSLCQFSPRRGVGCSRCLDVCPVSAVFVGETGLEIDQLRCLECGACVSICPTGAIQYERFNDNAFSAYLAQLEIIKGSTIVVGSEDALHAFWWRNRSRYFENTFFMEYPEIGALCAWHLLLFMARGACQVLLLRGQGQKVPDVLDAQISFVNTVMELLFDVKEPVRLAHVNDAVGIMEGRKEALDLQLPSKTFHGRRRDLSRILLFLVEHGAGRGVIGPPLSDSFGDLVCDTSLCTECLACLNECKQEALRAEEASFVLSFEPSLCVQCGLCASVCPEGALRLNPGLVLERRFFERRVLAEAEPARCRDCGKIFGTRKSLEKVKAILSGRADLDIELFEYCEDCRVRRFFEQEGDGK